MVKKIDRYDVECVVGQGGSATVYRAYDPLMKRQVAIKVLSTHLATDPEIRDRFRLEAEVIARLEHDAIVPVYDLGVYEGQQYIVMRYMSGGSLLDRQTEGPVTMPELVGIFDRVARALDAAHAQNIIHRDLKPGNILFDAHAQAFLSDFGTPAYLSPEQASGAELDSRSDVYSLGAVLFQTLTNQTPYQSDTPIALAMKHITEPVPSVLSVKPDLPPDCDLIITQAMAKDRADRYATASDLAADLATIARGEPIAPRLRRPNAGTARIDEVSSSNKETRRSSGFEIWVPWRWQGVLIGGVALVLLLVIGLLRTNWVEQERPTQTAWITTVTALESQVTLTLLPQVPIATTALPAALVSPTATLTPTPTATVSVKSASTLTAVAVHPGFRLPVPQLLEPEDGADFGAPSILNFIGEITLEAWVNVQATDDIRNIVAHGYTRSPDAEVLLRIEEGEYEVGSWNGRGHATSYPVPPQDIGSWVYLVGVYDGEAWRLYRNGVEVSFAVDTIGALAVDASWAIGANGAGTERFFQGLIDRVAIHNRALLPQEVRTRYLEMSESFSSEGATLDSDKFNVLLLHFDEPTGAVVFSDASRFKSHGACSGVSCPVAGEDGQVNKALYFDGIDDYVSVSVPIVPVLKWQAVKPSLAPNELYLITLSYHSQGRTQTDYAWTQQTSWSVDEYQHLLDLSDNAQFSWSVKLLRQTGVDSADVPTGVDLSKPSEERIFYWYVSAPVPNSIEPSLQEEVDEQE